MEKLKNICLITLKEQKWIKRHTSIHITVRMSEENKLFLFFRKKGLDLDIQYTTKLLSNDNVIRPSLQKFINSGNNFAYRKHEIYMCMIGKSDEKVFKNSIDNYFNFKANNYIDNVFVEENEVSIKYKDTIERYGFVLVKNTIVFNKNLKHGTIEFHNHMSEYKNVKLKNIINTIKYNRVDDKQYILLQDLTQKFQRNY